MYVEKSVKRVFVQGKSGENPFKTTAKISNADFF